jgi:anti-sigma B factor antagonist
MSFDAARAARTDRDGIPVVAPLGDLDLASAREVRQVLEEAIEQSRNAVVDLSRTTFLDSSGVGALVMAGNLARDRGGWLRLAGPRDEVLRVLDLTQVSSVLPTYDSVDEAIAGSAPHDGRSGWREH